MKENNYDILKKKIVNYIKDKQLTNGDRLPTVKEIINNYGFSYSTVHRTLIELEKDGIIKTHPGKGLYVNNFQKNVSNQIGLIIPSPAAEYKIFMNILNGIRSVLESTSYKLLISISDMNHQLEAENINLMIQNNVAGLIIFPEDYYLNHYEHILHLKNKNYPFVLIDRYIPEMDTDYVIIDNKAAMFRLCSYLKYNKNCEKIIFVKDDKTSSDISSSAEKINGYQEAVKLLYGNDKNQIISLSELKSDYVLFKNSGYKIGFTFNHDAILYDFVNHLSSNKTEIPVNFELFGYNNSHDPVQYPTVEQFNEIAGKKAAEILLTKIADPQTALNQIRIDPKLIIPDKNGVFRMEV